MSSLRRSAPAIHRQLRSIVVPSSSLIVSPINTGAPNSQDKNPSLLKWISAAVLGAGIGVSLYSYSPSTVKSAMSLADWLTSTADRVKEWYDGQALSNSNFFIRDALRRRIFFNYEKRLRTLSPPEKML